MAVTLEAEVSPRKPDLVDLTRIPEVLAEMGKFSKETGKPIVLSRAFALAERDDFPKVWIRVGRRRLWRRADIQRWAKTWDQRSGYPLGVTRRSKNGKDDA